jgi:hypothetical protein
MDPLPLVNPSDPLMLIRFAKMCSNFSLTGLKSVPSPSIFPIGFSCLFYFYFFFYFLGVNFSAKWPLLCAREPLLRGKAQYS